MSTAPAPTEVHYPERDGKPMGETDLHIHWIVRLRDILKWHYRNEQTYVAADLLVYYEEGNPRKVVVPDVFVVKDCDPGMRRVYKIWEEPSPPQFIIEVTSLASKRADTKRKPQIYHDVGVSEYFVYDPTADYVRPPLRGFRRTVGGFCDIEPDADGGLVSEVLDIRLRLEEGGAIGLYDLSTGDKLPTAAEAAQQARERERIALEAERQAREVERQAREEEHRAREAAEAELQRLRERLRQLGEDF